jgi:hypothetical protein
MKRKGFLVEEGRLFMQRHSFLRRFCLSLSCAFALVLMALAGNALSAQAHTGASTSPINAVFDQAASQFQVPAALLKTLCYMEGHLSNHSGNPSMDHGYGCMHLVKNSQADTLDQAATLLHVSADQLKTNIATNILGGAAVLRAQALQLSGSQTLPTSLADWYGAVAAYSHATTQPTATMYADQVYSLLNSGFSAVAETGETVTVTPQHVTPNKATAGAVKAATTLPQGCVNDGKTDYPGAIDCILNPSTYDCNVVPANAPCTYEDANRPADYPISFVGIHDIEGTALDALNVFQNPNSAVSIHYIVDSDGTVYQVLHEKDIAYQIGNFWYNQRSIGIEHAGFDATGFLWYNATEYLASAKLVAYLLEKYHIPLDHDHVVSHGTVPAPTLATSPNHVDPGPYWLWDYYLGLIHKQGVPYAPIMSPNYNQSHVITLHPSTDQRPFGANGTETAANFNFFYLYNGPSTTSGLIPSTSNGGDVTDETYNVEPDMSYFYIAKVKDPAGTGDTMYEIWYGENDQTSATPPQNELEDAHLAWLAVPPGTATYGGADLVTVNLSGASNAQIYGRPVSSVTYVIGNAPNGAVFASRISVIESGTNTLWYQINYNHRQAWVPVSEATIVHASVPA